ncbi:host attachment protein [Ramlibacter sp. MMS24-I3-19]|uniref:host attachment protein n=1 Tax=Ramlibacter sp. MMS24-I3-19 TaxID=3416606 RepID=UPI003D014446
MAQPDWVLIANATRGCVYERAADGHLRLVRSFDHLASRQHSAQLGDDKAGREINPSGFGGAAFERRADPHRKEHERFARELAAFVEQGAQADAFASLAIFAPDPFLGELRHELGAACLRRLSTAQGPDLSHVGIAELPKRIGKALHEPAPLGHGA